MMQELINAVKVELTNQQVEIVEAIVKRVRRELITRCSRELVWETGEYIEHSRNFDTLTLE